MKLYLRILSYLRPQATTFAVAAVATFVFAALDAATFVLVIPFVEVLFLNDGGGGGGAGAPSGLLERWLDATVYRLVDLDGPTLQAINTIILLIFAVVAVKNVFDFGRAYLVARVEQAVTRDLRDEVYDHLLDLDLAFFGRTRTGQIVSRLTYDVEQLRTLVTRQLAKILSSVFEVVAAVVLMVGISSKLTLAALVVVPGAMGVWGPLVKRLRRGDRRVLDLAGEVNSHVQETVAGIRLVKSSSAEGHERRRFHGLTGDFFRTFVRTEGLRALAAPITELLAALGTVVILWYGARLVVVEQTVTGAEFVGFLALSLKLYAPVKFAAKLPATIQPGLVAGERIFEFLDAPIEIEDRSGARVFPGLVREVRFEDVSFAYREGEPVLQNLDLVVPKGSVVALVGPSGGGKTTVVDLLARFYEPTSGRIVMDETDVQEFSVSSLRKALGIVSQETVLFHDTVRANIAYGLEGVEQEALEAAARAASAHDFIMALRDGYDTVVGERGTELSGGQRQRLSIARAILRDPPILIFDEATSALDTEAERLVQAAVERLLAGRTVIVIAHRLSTVQRADQIVVLDEGRVVERGSHDALMAEEGLYRRLYEMQFHHHGHSGAPIGDGTPDPV